MAEGNIKFPYDLHWESILRNTPKRFGHTSLSPYVLHLLGIWAVEAGLA